ncbi:EamA family transporter [Myxococcota bacterium]|nr:EamA family transporter [Myxococcota bacterium]
MSTPEPSPTTPGATSPPVLHMVAAFASVYVLWGSTYIAIRFALETLPALVMAGARFLLAGSVLFAIARMRGAARPSAIEWRSSAIVGTMLLLFGNGGVVLAEQRGVPSGLAALLVGGTPLWMTIIDAVRPNGVRPTRGVVLGLVAGLSGVALLVGPDALSHGTGSTLDALGVVMTLAASLSWSLGSLYSRHAEMPASPLLSTGMQMLSGGVLLTLVGLLQGELATFELANVTLRSALSWLHLVVAGSLLGFTAYIWLLRHTTPARAASYAYVNPVIAVLLGWGLADEAITPRMVLAMVIILGSLAIIARAKAPTRA